MDVPCLQGDGIYLRELRESDLEGNWYAWFNDAEVTVYQNKNIFPNTREKQRFYYDYLATSKSDVVFAVVDQSTNQHIGNVGLHHIDWVHRSAELGVVLGERAFWGKGYGKQSWSLITQYGFETLNLHRIYAVVMKGNVSSQKCAEAAGFKREGLIREVFFKNGRYLDIIYYNLLKKEWESR